LTGLFDEHTSIQAEKLVEAFIGKWVRVSGTVGNVTAIAGGGAKVQLPRDSEHSMVFMRFNDKSVVEVLKKGDPITVIGKIRQVSTLWLELENCELEKP
jgi:hypothetical protein